MDTGQTLLIDADDTLWENNIYFEEVVAAFCELMGRYGHPVEAARQALIAVERIRTQTNGYGIRNFRASLLETCRRLLDAELEPPDGEQLDTLCTRLAHQSLALLPGVAETLQELSGRHRLILFTKGDLEDQSEKVLRSGLARYLHRVDVVREKDPDSYRSAIVRHGIRPSQAWMVGNSPRSDVLPALAVGLGAVFIPHRATWELELAELPPAHDRFVVLERFTDLVRLF